MIPGATASQNVFKNVQKAQNDTNQEIKSNLLDLPTEILEKILPYLPATAIYVNVRNVCQRLQVIADSHVQLGKQGK